MSATAYIGLGANLGQPEAAIGDAIQALAALPATHLCSASSLYRTAPIEADGQDYVNAVVALQTALDPQTLLTALQQIELQFGRMRSYRNAPRTLDCDLLLYDQQIIKTDTLLVPHPRLHLRAFVLVPLLEIAPIIRLPGLGQARDFLAGVSEQLIQRLC